MKRFFIIFFTIVSVDAAACGICIDDKVASCYDHAVVMSARERGHEVAFFAIEGSLPLRADVRAALLRAVQGARGVLRGTARVSLESAALSFAYDPARATHGAIQAALEERLARRGLRLKLLWVLGRAS